MPTSSSAVTGDFNPTPFRTHKTKSGKILETVQEETRRPTPPPESRQVDTDLTNVEEIPSTNKITRAAGFTSSKIFRGIMIALGVCAAATAVTVPLAIVLPRSTATSNSGDQTTGTTATTATTTSATTTTATTATTTTATTSTTTTSSTSRTSSTTSTSTTSTSTTSSSSTSTSSTTSTSTTATTTTTTSVAQSPSFWSFDNTTVDNTSIFSGVGVNNPTFYTPGIDGYGAALSIIRANSQYVNVATYRNLTYTSFTVSLWFYWTGTTGNDFGFFGQCQTASTSRSLHYQIRNYVLQLAFFADDLVGTTTIQANVWYHVAFVYDYPSSTQIIYLNGRLEASRTSSPYQGTSGDTVIGKTEQVPGTPNYFSGYIDQVSVVMRTKNATEVWDEATLVTWHSFDTIPYSDSGSLRLRTTAINITSVSGRVNQAIRFTSSLSYYQMIGFVLLGVSNNTYSISVWIRPTVTNGSTVVHLSTTVTGQGWCVDLMGFSSSGQIIVTGWGSTNQQVIGPILPINTWSHVVDTYSVANGHRLYVNGTLIGSTGSMNYAASSQVNILTLGNPLQGVLASAGGTCNAQSIVPGAFLGSLDEFRVYSRELNTTDIFALANP